MINMLQWVLGLETSPFAKGIDTSTSKLKHFEKEAHSIKLPDFGKQIGKGLGSFGADSLKSLAAPLLTTLAAVGSVGAVMEGMKGSLDLGSELEKISSRTGMGVESVVMLRKAFKDADVDVEKLGSSTNKMQKFLAGAAAGGEGGDMLRKMGLDPQALASAKPEVAFEKIGAAINSLPNPTERAAAAMQIFGKSGGELLAVFSSEAFRNAGNISNTAKILGENAAAFKQANEALNHVGGKLQGFFAGMASSFVPALLPLLEKFDKMDFSSWGVNLGNIIGNFSTNWSDEMTKLGQFLSDVVALALTGDGLASFSSGLVIAASGLGDALIKVFKAPLDYLQAGMQYAVENMSARITSGPIGKALTATAVYAANGLPGLAEYAATGRSPLTDGLHQMIGTDKASSLADIYKDIHSRKNGVEEWTSGNAETRATIYSDFKERAARLAENLKKSLHPVITATEETNKANAEGRKNAEEKINKGLNGDWNANDLGGKHSGGGGVVTGAFNADAFAASMRYRGTGAAGEGDLVGNGISTPAANPVLTENKIQSGYQKDILAKLSALFDLAQHPTATLVAA